MRTDELASFVYAGLQNGLATIINNPNDKKIACKIGEYWFYFIDPKFENWTVQKVHKTFSDEDLAMMISQALKDMGQDDFLDEVNYYEAILLKPYVEQYVEKEN